MLQEQTVCAEKTSKMKAEQINDLEKEKERLLSELVQSESKREKEIKMITDVYEGRLKEVAKEATDMQRDLTVSKAEADERRKDVIERTQVNKCLMQKLQVAQSIISEKELSLARITSEKASLKSDLEKAVDIKKHLLEHNESLITSLMELENKSAHLRLQLDMSTAQFERKTHLRVIFREFLEHRIANLKTVQEDVIADKNEQLERIDTIDKRLSELDLEETNLRCEQQEVAAIRETQQEELAQAVDNLAYLEECQKNGYLMENEPQPHENLNIVTLKETVDELLSFVESCKMRIFEIDQRMKEIDEEKCILIQQQSHASDRKNEYVQYLTLFMLVLWVVMSEGGSSMFLQNLYLTTGLYGITTKRQTWTF